MQTPNIIIKSSAGIPDYSSVPGFMMNKFNPDTDKTDSLKHVSSLGGQYGFFNHVFDTSESSKGEILNVCQYALLAIIPVVLLNKFMARMIPDPDPDASTIELITEITMQIVIILIGMILIHRAVTYVPTWSQFRYEPFILTNSILVFLIIVMSLNTKLGLKCSMLYDRFLDFLGWGDLSRNENEDNTHKKNKRYSTPASSSHNISQADNSSIGGGMDVSFPQLPVQSSTARAQSMPEMFGSSGSPIGLASANSLLGSAFH